MSKQYGLILPRQKNKDVAQTANPVEIKKPSIFDESSDSDDSRPQPKPKSRSLENQASALDRRMARSMREKALEEDPTVFQYDELYDEMESKREGESKKQSSEPKKPKYIGRLIEYAERRKLENELRIERQIQKERELEGEEFKDKEAFVTEAYRKKLEERQKLEEEEKRHEYLEAIGDVTKQKDLDGFYRHLYEQKLGTTKEVKKPDLTMPNTSTGDDEISYKPIKPQQRAYRKRHSSDDEDDGATPKVDHEAKKIHLQNNIDADSDFSIDSSSDDECSPKKKADTPKAQKEEGVEVVETQPEVDDKAVEENSEKPVQEDKNSISPPPRPKIDKTEIWKKRTTGDVFETAVKRYFERKATRGGG